MRARAPPLSAAASPSDGTDANPHDKECVREPHPRRASRRPGDARPARRDAPRADRWPRPLRISPSPRSSSVAGPRTPTDVMPNKFVEANGYAREVLERTFRFSPKNLGVFAVFGIAVPVIIYKGCVAEFVSASPSPNPTPLHRPIPGARERRRTSCARRPARGFFPFGDRIRPARGRAPTGGGTLKITTPRSCCGANERHRRAIEPFPVPIRQPARVIFSADHPRPIPILPHAASRGREVRSPREEVHVIGRVDRTRVRVQVAISLASRRHASCVTLALTNESRRSRPSSSARFLSSLTG